ncbi:MAG: DEAD/DEAH box helicase [Proteobacteria bacterium]|nr:MAG: DEAD/DEAH box helicase [Pseudomonadota bacterium]
MAELLHALRHQEGLREGFRHHEVLPERPPAFGALPPGYERLAPALARRGVDALYLHQARALAHLAAGEDVVLATPTASGKTLVYNLPVLRSLAAGEHAHALYLFPLKALERDQRDRLEADVRALGWSPEGVVEIYDGDTPTSRRKKIREHPPRVLVTTPDMLHMGILPQHASWRRFFESLALVVVDELHTYRGVFGAHVAQVLRRLLRAAAHHGARPQIVAASATIANPGELAQALTGRSFAVIEADGAPRPRRHVVLVNPDGSPYTAAAKLFRAAISLGLRTIAFTKARRITELIHTWVVEAEPQLRERVSSYRAGFLAEERREIEAKLFSGKLDGVISTSALEMGIDVGGLDVCILVGYPGSQMATWQRAGRVGRAQEGLVVLIAQPDALDQYLVSHPRMLFEREFEHAVVDPNNVEIAAAHLPCAADEIPLRAGEAWLAEPGVRASVEAVEERGRLLRSEAGTEWFASRRRPHRDVDLRQAGSSYAIELDLEQERPVEIGTIGGGRVLAECHEGAIYLHRGRQYLVTELDLDEKRVRVRAVDAPWFTRAVSEKETEILSRDAARPAGHFRLARGRLRVTTRITGFERRRVHGQELIGSEPLELPPSSIETTGIWLEIPDEIPAALRAAGLHPMGGLHAVEHAALSLFPLFALCDRHDVGGITTLGHAQVGRAAIFLYDGAPGGMGLATSLWERVETLLEATLERVRDCPCEEGCPACVHSPKCGSGNRPIDKAAAIRALGLLLAHEPLPQLARAEASPPAAAAAEPAPAARPARLVFVDVETQRSAEEVGGWHNAQLMRVALAVTWDAADGRFESWREREVQGLLARLAEADLVVGFNVRRFDYEVLRGYTDRDLARLPTFDVLDAIRDRIGFRLPLGHLAEENLGVPKGADGLQSLAWWKEGRVDEIERYCRRDVELLRDLFDRAVEQRFLLFRTRDGERVRIPTPWTIAALVERAAQAATAAAPRGRESARRGSRSRDARARVEARAEAPR